MRFGDIHLIAVLFAEVERLSKGQEIDIVSEDGTRENAQGVREALLAKGFDAQCVPVGDDVSGLIRRLTELQPQAIFNLAETVLGESSLECFVPDLLDFLGIPYTGSDAAAINLCLDKVRTKQVLLENGIPTPSYQVMETASRDALKISLPVIVKPIREDGSLGIHQGSVVREKSRLAEQVDFIVRHYHQPALVEEYVGDREFNVAILGNGSKCALPLCEIDYSSMPEGMPKIVSFNAKWFPDSPEYQGSMPVCPAKITKALAAQIEKTAFATYKACGLRDYGRIDLRWDEKHPPTVVDVNPNPAITPDAGFVLSSRMAGIGYPDLLEKITSLALARHEP